MVTVAIATVGAEVIVSPTNAEAAVALTSVDLRDDIIFLAVASSVVCMRTVMRTLAGTTSTTTLNASTPKCSANRAAISALASSL